MSVLAAALIAIVGGLATFLLSGRRRLSLAVGAVTVIGTIAASAEIGPGDAAFVAGTAIAGSDGLRVLALAWSSGLAALGLADALVGGGGTIIGPSLMALGTAVFGLAVADAGVGFAMVTAAGLVAVAGPLPWLAIDGVSGHGQRLMRPILGAGFLTLAAVAWGASPIGPFGSDPFQVAIGSGPGVGLAFIAVAAAVAIRLGAIPIHAWLARLAESAPAGSLPAALGWSAAAFALVALSWIDVTLTPTTSTAVVERQIVLIVAVASILLAGIAALVHDDLEHILGYSVIQDGGIVLLSFAVLRSDAADAGRDWIVGLVAVKAGFAAWVLVMRAVFRVRRLSELRGWARSAPILGLAFALVTIGSVGLPGMATYAARGTLIDLALPGPLDSIVLLAAFAPVAYLGRVLYVGLDRKAEAAWGAATTVPSLRAIRPTGWSGVSVPALALAIPRLVDANRFAIAAMSALLVAVIGLAVAIGGDGVRPDSLGTSAAVGAGPGHALADRAGREG